MDVIILGGDGIKRSYMVQRFVAPYKIAHFVRKAGYSCQVIDFITRMDEDQLYRAIKKFITPETAVIGFSTTFISMDTYRYQDGTMRAIPEHIVKVLRNIRSEHPRIRIVVGGHSSEMVDDFGVIDATVMCYGPAPDDVFLEYVDWVKGRGDEPICVNHQPRPGAKARPWYNQARNPKYNIETDDFRFTKQDCILPGEPLPLDMSRGCIFACRFCRFMHLGKKKFDYLRSLDLIEQEIRHNKESFGTNLYYIVDDTFNDSEWKMQEFHKMSSNLGFRISYSAYVRADLVHRFPDTAHLLQESGLVAAQHGIETLHAEDSKIIGKGWSGTHAREFIPRLYHDIWRQRVNQHLTLIVGLPNSTEKDVWEAVDWFIDNRLDSSMFFPLSIFPPTSVTPRTATSEFDRDHAKYGFEWETIVDPNGASRQAWKNKNWTQASATAVATAARDKVRLYNRVNNWDSMPLRWYGLSEDAVLTTRFMDLDKEWYLAKGREMVALYHRTLMELS